METLALMLGVIGVSCGAVLVLGLVELAALAVQRLRDL